MGPAAKCTQPWDLSLRRRRLGKRVGLLDRPPPPETRASLREPCLPWCPGTCASALSLGIVPRPLDSLMEGS